MGAGWVWGDLMGEVYFVSCYRGAGRVEEFSPSCSLRLGGGGPSGAASWGGRNWFSFGLGSVWFVPVSWAGSFGSYYDL